MIPSNRCIFCFFHTELSIIFSPPKSKTTTSSSFSNWHVFKPMRCLIWYWQDFGRPGGYHFIQGRNIISRFNFSWYCCGGVRGSLPLGPWAASSPYQLSFSSSQLFLFMRRLLRLHFYKYVVFSTRMQAWQVFSNRMPFFPNRMQIYQYTNFADGRRYDVTTKVDWRHIYYDAFIFSEILAPILRSGFRVIAVCAVTLIIGCILYVNKSYY